VNFLPRTLACGIVAGLALGITPVAGQQPTLLEVNAVARPVPMSEAVEAAWRKAVQSAEANGQVRRAQAERTAASSLFAAPPALELSHRDDRLQSNRGARETEVGFAMPLWLPGQRSAREAAARVEGEFASLAATVGHLRVAAAVREVASDIALQRAEADLADANLKSLEALTTDVERRVAAGDLARIDALASRAEFLAAQSLKTQALQRLRAAQLQWTALTGMTQEPSVSEPAKDANGAADHPVIQLASLSVELARRRLDAVSASKRSPPELVARLRQDVSNRNESTVNSLGFALRIPLGTAARNDQLMAAAVSELEVAQATEQRQREQVAADIKIARAALRSAADQLETERARTALLTERARLLDNSFRAGETSLPEILRTTAALSQARLSVTRQELAIGLAQARLHQALGILP